MTNSPEYLVLILALMPIKVDEDAGDKCQMTRQEARGDLLSATAPDRVDPQSALDQGYLPRERCP